MATTWTYKQKISQEIFSNKRVKISIKIKSNRTKNSSPKFRQEHRIIKIKLNPRNLNSRVIRKASPSSSPQISRILIPQERLDHLTTVKTNKMRLPSNTPTNKPLTTSTSIHPFLIETTIVKTNQQSSSM